jgi:hypothetical protein
MSIGFSDNSEFDEIEAVDEFDFGSHDPVVIFLRLMSSRSRIMMNGRMGERKTFRDAADTDLFDFDLDQPDRRA